MMIVHGFGGTRDMFARVCSRAAERYHAMSPSFHFRVSLTRAVGHSCLGLIAEVRAHLAAEDYLETSLYR
jgi:hypothetical protein